MDRITETKEYNEMYQSSEKIFGKYVIAYFNKKEIDLLKLGIVASKKAGIAVVRNRIKRLIKESIRQIEQEYSIKARIVIISKKDLKKNWNEINLYNIKKDITNLFKKAGIING